MLALNRSAIVVRPKSPFLDWLHAADPTSVTLTLPDLARKPTIYGTRVWRRRGGARRPTDGFPNHL